MSIVQRCALVGLARSTHYYEPVPERPENLILMRVIDALFLKRPFYGVPRMTDWLRTLGHAVNHKRVARLMRLMNLQAVVPGPHTSPPHPAHAVYPYLLRDLVVDRPNYVWCADSTYVPLRRGFLSLVAVLDWYSRYVLAWALSNTLEARFCLSRRAVLHCAHRTSDFAALYPYPARQLAWSPLRASSDNNVRPSSLVISSGMGAD